MTEKNTFRILIADDDPEDRNLISEAFEIAEIPHELFFVKDGEELLDYLKKRKAYSDCSNYKTPAIILLDLNMPRKDGREALKEIKSDPELHNIPVIVLTTSNYEEDIKKTYLMGVNGFVTKPVTFMALVDALKGVCKYWLDTVKLSHLNNN